MPLVQGNRIQETSSTTGTGTYTLLGASPNFRAFSAICVNTDTVHYTAVDQNGNGWEIGEGTWETGNTLARTTIQDSTNAGAAVNWGAGTRNLFITISGNAPTPTPGTSNKLFAITEFVTTADNLKANLTGAIFTGGISIPFAPGSFTVPTGNFLVQASRLALTGSQRVTVAGTSIVRII